MDLSGCLVCEKCKKPVPQITEHKCNDCDLRLCRPCDDSSALLNWYESISEDKDVYVCRSCEKRRKKKDKKLLPA